MKVFIFMNRDISVSGASGASGASVLRTTRGYLNLLIVVGDFGGGVKFFEKIFVEIFVFHI